MSAFSTKLAAVLAERAMKQIDLVRAMESNGDSISFQYVHFLVTGQRIPPPQLVEKICKSLKLSRLETTKFHVAAAVDSGYRIEGNARV
jgi:hypothetical protein